MAAPSAGDPGAFAPAPSARERDAAASRLVLCLVAVTALARLTLADVVGLSVDEAYTVVMGRRLALGYFDHPPVVYWLCGVAGRLAGSEARFVVRLPFVLLAGGTTWLLFRLGSLLFGARVGLLAAVLLNLSLFLGVVAASWVLPDGPLLFFSAAAALCLARAVFGAGDRAMRLWLEFGAWTGLALLSKYHGIFLLAGAALFLGASPAHRRWLRRPEPWLALAAAVLVFSPVVLWNASHHWASLRFQGGRAVTLAESHGSLLLDSLAGQAAWTSPWLWPPLLLALFAGLRRGPRDERRFLLACLAVGPILGFTLLTACGVRGLAHWQAPGYFFALPLLAAEVADRLAASGRWTRRWLIGSAVATAVLVGVLVTHARSGWLGTRAPWLFTRGDPTHDLLDWEAIASQLDRWGQPAAGVVVAGTRWSEAGKLAYALGPRVEVTSVGEDPRGFRFLRADDSLIGRDVLLVASRRDRSQEPLLSYAPYFDAIAPLGSVPVLRGGRVEFLVSVYLARGLRRPIPEQRRR